MSRPIASACRCGFAAAQAEAHSRPVQEQAFREWFGLRTAEASILAALYAAEGTPVSAAALGRDRGSVQVHVHRLRGAMDPGAVLTRSREGYQLTPDGLDECRRALLEFSERRRGVERGGLSVLRTAAG